MCVVVVVVVVDGGGRQMTLGCSVSLVVEQSLQAVLRQTRRPEVQEAMVVVIVCAAGK